MICQMFLRRVGASVVHYAGYPARQTCREALRSVPTDKSVVKKRITLLVLLCCATSGIVFAEKPFGRIGLYTETMDQAGFARIQEMLADASITPALVSFSDDWGPQALLIMVKPPVAERVRGSRIGFAQKLGTYYFRGGRIVLVDVPGAGNYPTSPDLGIWNNLTR